MTYWNSQGARMCAVVAFFFFSLLAPALAADSQDLLPSENPLFQSTQDTEGLKKALPSLPLDVRPAYHASIKKSLKSMGLVEDHLELWISSHPTSALKHLRYMPSGMQLRVANLATFIRKENSKLDPKTAWRESVALVHYSHKYGVPVPLAVGVAHVESRFLPNAESRKGALGVMQVRWSVHSGLLSANGITRRDQMFDPEKGVAAGCLLLSRYIRAYGSVQEAMNRYYGGSALAYMRKVNRNIAKLVNHESKSATM